MAHADFGYRPIGRFGGFCLAASLIIQGARMALRLRPSLEDHVQAPRIETPLNQPPHYSLGDNMCSRYARLAAKDLFGLLYAPGDAWDLGEANTVVWSRENTTNSESWASVVRPGHILGFYNPQSDYNRDGRSHTHVGLYVGDDRIFHQYGSDILESRVSDFLQEKKMRVVQVIAPK